VALTANRKLSISFKHFYHIGGLLKVTDSQFYLNSMSKMMQATVMDICLLLLCGQLGVNTFVRCMLHVLTLFIKNLLKILFLLLLIQSF